MKLIANSTNPPLGALIVADLVNIENKIEVEWGEETSFVIDGETFDSNAAICRYLARSFKKSGLYGSSVLEQIEVDHWISFALGPVNCANQLHNCVSYLNKVLATVTYLVANKLTLADILLWSILHEINEIKKLVEKQQLPSNFERWYTFIGGNEHVARAVASLPVKNPEPASSSNVRKEEGKFVDLPGAEMGKVVVRFPPEASGFLHIGHAKAALLNQYYQEAFQGKLIMRFDDTNPAKEKVDFEKVILEDLELLEIKPDQFTHTSSYFDLMLAMCERLIKEGKAYVDFTDPEQMKAEREQRQESINRNNSVEKNLEKWSAMKEATEYGQKCCVRAKIDMSSANGCMRDPTIYRCKAEAHPRTGTKYKVYPTYDFACPIVDSIEGVTHCLRTMEYHDRDDQFFWFIDALSLRKPYIWEYSRLNMTNTVLSKRKLTWFVENGYVDGWDDPRFPTVRGILRRGMTVEGLKQFIIAQGSSRSVVVMEWDKIWAFNKKVIDPVAPRYTAIEGSPNGTVKVLVKDIKEEKLVVAKHPKNPDVGTKPVWVSSQILIDYVDAETLKEGENTTFINWGNLKIKKINKESGRIVSIDAEPNLDDKDYKKTTKLTWLAETPQAPFVPCVVTYFDHIISKAILVKDEDFKSYIGHNTKSEVKMIGDPELANVKQSEIIQLQRKGFFICDSPYKPASIHTGRESPISLFFIPDGHTKEMATQGLRKKTEELSIKEELSNSNESWWKNPPANRGRTMMATHGRSPIMTRAAAQKKQTSKGKEAERSPQEEVVPIVPQVSAIQLNEQINAQGNKIRRLKADKVPKAAIEPEVQTLLNLKNTFKIVTGQDWKPGFAGGEGVGNASSPKEINDRIVAQGDKVRNLKNEKVAKNVIDAAVSVLLELKAEFKKVVGQDWKPGVIIDSPVVVGSGNSSAKEINERIVKQGDKVRTLKNEKAAKNSIDTEVKVLLELKAEFKKATGQDWKVGIKVDSPDGVAPSQVKEMSPAPVQANKPDGDADSLNVEILQQGDKIRSLKCFQPFQPEKAEKKIIEEQVKVLLALKAKYKTVSGKEWKPSDVKQTQPSVPAVTPSPAPPAADSSVTALVNRIKEVGDKIRQLKADKADKNIISAEVAELLLLKKQYKAFTGKDWTPDVNNKAGGVSNADNNIPSAKKEKSPKPPSQKKQPKEKTPPTNDAAQGVAGTLKKVTRLGLEAKKEEQLSDWYSQVITKGEMIEYYDVSGCYVLRPWSFAIWESIKDYIDAEIKKHGVRNCYFPIFVSQSVLEKEKDHIADFAPEVAWVTKSGDSDLAEPIAIRPTSETVMYPAFAKWIQSYRDLPLKLNQWNNVVRWEFKHPQPFLRTREFLWQEGHTAYAGSEEAQKEVYQMLDMYQRVYTDLLAVPVVKGRKTEKEKFAGGNFTTTVEAFISANGRAIQGATSHFLGQNFSKMFEVVYEDPETQEMKYVYQNSWGITTRTIGVMIMVHSDNQGLVLPPRVAAIQVVIVPCGITASLSDNDKKALLSACSEIETKLAGAGVRVQGDYRDNYSPGWKFNHWELKGVPIRLELGPKDMKAGQLVLIRRDTGVKTTVKSEDTVQQVMSLLEEIHNSLLKKATEELNSHIVVTSDWKEFVSALDRKCIIMSPFCGEIPCEDLIKQDSARDEPGEAEAAAGLASMGAKSLCIPFDQPRPLDAGQKCVHPACSKPAMAYVLFGRSY